MLFDGYENEKERIFKEGNKLNPVFVRRLKDTIKIYTGIFKLMCMEKQKKVSSFRARRVDRKNSLNAYEKGCTQSFVSCSKGGYGTQFANKNQVILLEVEVSGESPYIDFQQKLTEDEYIYYNEQEILFPPFLPLKIEELALTKGEKKMIKDMHNNPPVGKYLIQKKDYKLLLSNLSRLIPSDFYGNRVSTKPECLFKSWKKQYQKYNQNSNDALKKYHTSLEYKYEVTLDLENFFPTINPIIIYHYIVKNLPAHLKKEDMNLMKRLLRKLLFCKLVTQLDEKMLKQYYKAFKSQTNNKETVKKSKDINVCGNIKQCEFARGIAQGLPQSYFLGNIYMIIVSRIFRNEFSGASYFYVDDSVIFTNDVIETEFKEQLKEINKQIEAKEREILQKHSEENLKIYPCKTKEFYESYLYGVHVHLEEKSAYTRLDSLDEGEVYLKSISRQMSQAGSDFFKMHSDEENKNLEKKFAVLSEQVKIKSEQLEKYKI